MSAASASLSAGASLQPAAPSPAAVTCRAEVSCPCAELPVDAHPGGGVKGATQEGGAGDRVGRGLEREGRGLGEKGGAWAGQEALAICAVLA